MSPISFHYGSHMDDQSTGVGLDSDREPTIVNALDEEDFSRYYWSGKVFVLYILADTVFQASPGSWGGIKLEAELSQAIIDFPYADCVEQLDALRTIDVPTAGPANARSGHWTFMTKLGAILARNPELRAKLASMVQTRGGTVRVDMNASQTLPPSPPDSFSLEVDEGNMIARYTSKLIEWCTQKGRNNIAYDDLHLSIDPPQWQVRVNVEGATFTGRAKKKTMAKHIASKQACEELGIRL